MISYAQNFEDVILARALGDRANGFYVDVGACFPDVASVTKHFYALGWSGINVEPMGEPFKRLQAERTRDINVRAAVASFTGEIPIYQGPSVGESSALRPFDTARPILVPCFTLADLCRRHVTRPIDFMKIDVEGLEHDVVKGGDWAQYRPAVVVVEVTIPWSTRRRPDAGEIGAFLRRKHYDEVYFDGLNAFYLAREAASLTSRFAAPPNVLDRFTVAREAELEAATDRLKANAESVGRRLSEIEAQASVTEREATALAARVALAEARAQQSEAWAQQSERAITELRDALREKENALLSAQRTWQDAVATVERQQMELARVTAELQAAELRVGRLAQASAESALRAETAFRDASDAVDALREAEGRAQRAEARSKDAEARAQAAEAKAQHALADAAQAGARAQQEDARARDLEGSSREAEARERYATARALQAEHTLASMLRSRSWRVTAPLRTVADMFRGGPRVSAPQAPARRAPLRGTRADALRRARDLAKRTPLYHWVAPRIKQRYPTLWMRARAFVLANPPPVPAAARPPAALPPAGSAGVHEPGAAGAIPSNPTIEELTSRIEREIARRRAR